MADELICAVRKRLGRPGDPRHFDLDASLHIRPQESAVTVLFGPSGAGKTTLLRLIAGLADPDSGEIRFRGEVWYDSSQGVRLPPQKRRAGFLFQEYALFPHLTVARNVEYAAPRAKAGELLEAFGLRELASRFPRELSGGQQQRVALARALAARPALLLLDEPLSALDEASRIRTRQELRRALLASGVPAIVVTHDRMEAVALGDWMAVIVDGCVRQAAPAAEIFRHPSDAEVARAVGVENVLPAEVLGRDGGLVTVSVATQRLQCLDKEGQLAFASGLVWACIRSEDVALARDAAQVSSARNRLQGRVQSVLPHGPLVRLELDCSGFPLVAIITAQSAVEMGWKPGDSACAIVKATAVHLLPR